MTSLLLLAMLAPAPRDAGGAALERGHRAFQAGEYREAARALDGLAARLPRNADYAQYLAAESEFYAGAPARARALFQALGRRRGSRFTALAPWRAADCLWAEGKRAEAVTAYRKLLGPRNGRNAPDAVDTVVARFRVAERAPAAEGRRQLWQIHVDSPAHPLSAEAAKRAGGPPAGAASATAAASAATESGIEPRERLRRASLLAEGKHYDEAIAELGKMTGALPPELAAERDLEMGTAIYRTRQDYPRAAALLLGAAPKLTGEKAAFAAFHGARALSRVDRDDEAIAGYRQVVERHPTSRWASEAQFLAGWLDFNRGRYRESLPGLRATVSKFGRSSFAADAAWYTTLAHDLLGQPAEALTALDQFARLSGGDQDAVRRGLYWRARITANLGRGEEARGHLRECVRRWPLDHYGLLARGRLRAENQPVELELAPAPPVAAPPRAAGADPALARAEELARAGLVRDAGFELERAEDEIVRRHGREAALPLLLERYGRMYNFRRAYALAETRGASALAAQPSGGARLVWEAAYPRAYRELAERHAQESGNPGLFLYAIMRKESGFAPNEVSTADARGLLQMIAARGQDMAARLSIPFAPDELFDPETNIRLGGLYIGTLLKTFRGQIYLAAGAYNGGVKPMMRWCDQHGARPFDEFVELITYRDSREYLKRVVGIYARYLYLYEGKVYELPAKIDPRYLKDGT